MTIKNPAIVKNIFDDVFFTKLKNHLFNVKKPTSSFEHGFQRFEYFDDFVKNAFDKILPTAKVIFNSETLVPSYALFSHYEGSNPNLFKHKDDNACTYTLDLCLYQTEPWDIYVEGIPYTLNENEALAFYGNDQEHWREQFPNPNSQYVGMIFFHFVEPEHWFITKGPKYLDVIRGIKTEQQFIDEQNTI